MNMGFDSAPRQSTADFLTSLTSPAERLIRPGWRGRTPQTADEFSATWKRSLEYTKLMKEIEVYDQTYPIGGKSVAEFEASRRAQQAVHQYVLPSSESGISFTNLSAEVLNLHILCPCTNR